MIKAKNTRDFSHGMNWLCFLYNHKSHYANACSLGIIYLGKVGEKMTMGKEYRTFRINIKKGHKLFSYFDDLSLNCNNLYNTTNFYIRQAYTALKQENKWQPLQKEVMDTINQNINTMNNKQIIAYHKRLEKELLKPKEERKDVTENLFDLPTKEKSFLGYNFLDCLFKTINQKDYYSLPGQINQAVMRNVVQNWKSFFASLRDFKKNPQKYNARPSIPGYKPKGGQKEVVLSNQICKLKNHKYLHFPKTKHRLNIGKLGDTNRKLQHIRIIPKYNNFTVEIVFLIGVKEEVEAKKERCMAIDLGLDNLAAVVCNSGMSPILFKGGKVKSINQWYNKLRSYHYGILRNGKGPKEGCFHSNKLNQLDIKRSHQIKDYFHKVSYRIIDIAKENNIDTIVIGKNAHWKQDIHIGRKNNQNFVQIPHSLLIQLITYKAEAQGMAVVTTEESYTSQSSFLDGDSIPTFQSGNKEVYTFSGKRVKRGLYRTKNKTFINADVNGAANILRKVVPRAFADGIAAVCSQPLVVNVR